MSDESLQSKDLIHDWAQLDMSDWPDRVEVWDESLRDGLQSPSVRDPDLDEKLQILHLMEELRIETADIGLPGAGKRQYDDVLALSQEIAGQKLDVQPFCAGRTLQQDAEPMADIMQKTGVKMGAALFIGSSPIRQFAEAWNLDLILKHTQDAVSFAVKEGLEVLYVTEDTIRSAPGDLDVLFRAAIDAGAARICLCDTVGAAIPLGVTNLVRWVKKLIGSTGAEVGIDWHGHRDRGMDIANCLAAVEGGATRIHGTALGIGERVGNAPMEQILVNLKLYGLRDADLSQLNRYVEAVSKATRVEIPVNLPIVGRDAFRTATGVHAAAVLKAMDKGDAWLADRVYSGVPASWIGRAQEIEVGHMSGASNILFYLRSRSLPTDRPFIEAILAVAKKSSSVLTEVQIREIVQDVAESGTTPGEAPD
jgi:2-isopropylmalate synthase